MAFQRSQWNQLISQVNGVRASPPSNTNCDPLPPINELPANTIWRKSHVTEVQNALAETCSSIGFGSVPNVWSQSILNEISSQLGNAWCDCEEDCGDPTDENGMEWELFTQGVEVFSNCPGFRPGPEAIPASSFTGDKQLKPERTGRVWTISARWPGLEAEERARGPVNCDGSLGAPTEDKGIYDATGVTVFCSGSCSDSSCQTALQNAEANLSQSNPATFYLMIIAISAECMPDCPPV